MREGEHTQDVNPPKESFSVTEGRTTVHTRLRTQRTTRDITVPGDRWLVVDGLRDNANITGTMMR